MYQSNPWYHTLLWRALRLQQLNRESLCAIHLRRGREVGATVCDHKVPFGDSWEMFIDPNNLQSLCHKCHISAKQLQQNKGVVPGCDSSGIPLDPNHWFNKK